MTRHCSERSPELTAFALGELTGPAKTRVVEHLKNCPACRCEAQALRNIIKQARELQRVPVTPTFHRRLMARIGEEIERAGAADGAAAAEILRLTLGERVRLNAGFVAYKLRQSAIAKVLLTAALISSVALLGISIIGNSANADLIPAVDENGNARAYGRQEQTITPQESDTWPELPSERVAESWSGLGVDRLEPPLEKFPAPEVSAPGEDSEDLLDSLAQSAEDIRLRVERENIMELGRYRFFARFNGMCKNQVIKGRGGDARTLNAVDQGLKWLRYHQEHDGSWDPERFTREPGHDFGGDPRTRVGLTALAVAAFLSDGHTEVSGRYADTASNGINYLLASRDSLGQFGAVAESPAISLFNQSVTVLVLAENYLLAGGRNEDELRLGVNRLISMISTLNPDQGHGTYSDTWAAMALRTVLMAGLEGEEVRQVCRTVENRVTLLAREESDKHIVAARVPPLYTASLEAVDALFEGQGLRQEEIEQPHDHTPFPDRHQPETMFALLDDEALREPSFLFFISTALCEESSAHWPAWNRRVKEILVGTQTLKGFWSTGGDWPWIDGGDVYTTALNILTLQVYYRFIKLEENCP